MLVLYFLFLCILVEFFSLCGLCDVVLVGGVGMLVVLLVYVVLIWFYESIVGFFVENSVFGGGGYNVVNVILVDFCGFDIFGEISVLVIVGVGIYVMFVGFVLYKLICDL